jgi:hypothetical protein
MSLRKLVDEEGVKLKQRARDKFILDGDENSKHFHLLAKCKRRKLKIVSLTHDDKTVQGEAVGYFFYKNLFGPSQETSISLANLHMKETRILWQIYI